jgi:hypothetical protein
MPTLEAANIYGVQIRESANDGSDFSNAVTDYRILFVGEDGLFHLKDSSGSVTTPTGMADPMTTRGDIIVRNAANATARLAVGAANTVLRSDGTDVAYALPAVTKLAQTVLGSDTPTITFSGISGSYENLWIVGTARTDRANPNDYIAMQFNADTGNNYDYTQWDSIPTSATVSTSQAFMQIAPATGGSATAGRASAFEIMIPGYARTVWHKSCLGRSVMASGNISTANTGIWSNTAAITQVLLKPQVGSNFKTGTVATLYGLSA